MFSPEMMKAATDMMSKMSPEQMQNMTKMAANMDPSVMQNMMNNQNMNPDDVSEKLKNMRPEDFDRALNSVNSGHLQNTDTYKINAATSLKNDGNQLINSDPASALAKYDLALKNLSELVTCKTKSVDQLRLSLLLNQMFAHLQLKEWNSAVDTGALIFQNSQTYAAFPIKYKTHFRMAIALRELDRWGEALYHITLAKKDHQGGKDDKVCAEFSLIESHCCVEDILQVEDASMCFGEATSTPDAVPHSDHSTNYAHNSNTSVSEACRLIQENPSMIDSMTEHMDKMSPEQLDDIARMGGASDKEADMMKQVFKNPELMKNVTNMMSKMDPKQIEEMTRMRQNMSSKSTHDSSTANTDPASAGGDLLRDPEMLKTASTMIDAMDDETLDSLVGSVTGQGQSSIKPKYIKMAIRWILWFYAIWLYVTRFIRNYIMYNKIVLLSIIVLIVTYILSIGW